MGKTKSKEIQQVGNEESEKMNERQTNINKLIERMTLKIEEPPRTILDYDNEKQRSDSDLRRRLSFKRKSRKKWEACENNNNNNVIDIVIDQSPLNAKCNLDCSEINSNDGRSGEIIKKDSIDNIIDLIVDKSIKRDETLNRLIEDAGKGGRRPTLKRSVSYHGEEKKKRKKGLVTMRSLDETGKREEGETLMARLENLEKRANLFEKKVELVGELWDEAKEEEESKKGAKEFERNMLNVLKETYRNEEPETELKTIERVDPFKRDADGMLGRIIAAPKADPIIRNTIDKLMQDEAATRGSEKNCEILDSVVQPAGESPKPILKKCSVTVQAARDPEGVQKAVGFLPENVDSKEVPEESAEKNVKAVKGGKTYCQNCKKKCSGEVLRVQDKYFHISCFKCKACKNSLAQGGFFFKDGAYYCTTDYQRQFGTKCSQCGEYVEGEVVTALGNTYHQRCFTCARCRQVFPSGERVTYTGKEVLCQKCVHIPVRDTRSPARSPSGANECAGCGEELKDGQALIALERQWHIWCFKCRTCDSVLHGEYMGKDGVPYCEKDYQKQFGVKCAYCSRFISGKVLQAGDNHHFHPTCARCSKCGDPFGDGEEMYLQGGAIWHPRCGPGPTENGTVVNGSAVLENGHCTDTDGEMSTREGRDFDRMSSSAVSEMQFSIHSRTPSLNGSLGSPCNSLSRKYAYHRTGSPGLILREYKSNQQYPEDISRIYTYSYLTEEPSHGYLKRPIDPYDKPPTSPHFHRPSSSHSQRSGSKIMIKTGSKSGMRVMAESIRSETPRPKSPHMNNEEPIELAHFPDAKKPKPGEKPKIERDDFPAPPYPYTDPERRKRWSDSYKGVSDDEDDEVNAKEKESEDAKLKREEQELSKIATGIGKVFLQNVKEREKMRQWKMQNLDPRNASRVPSANKEPAYRLRYQSPVNASPSRNMDHPRPWEEDELDRSSSYYSSVGRSVGAIPSYNVTSSSSRLGYVRPSGKASTLPGGRYMSGYCSDYGGGYNGDFSFSGFGEKTHSTEFSSGKSDISGGSISEVDRRALNVDMPVSTTFQGGLRYSSYSPHMRSSLPTLPHMSNEPPKIYPYHLLVITNYRLPSDVDRCNLERHLSDSEFEQRFQCSRSEFYRLPQWRRNDMKRRLKLF